MVSPPAWPLPGVIRIRQVPRDWFPVIQVFSRWLAGLGADPDAPERAVPIDRLSRPSSSRFSEDRPTSRRRSRFALEIERWLAINHWSPVQFASLTEQCRDPALVLSEAEILAVITGSRLELMPRHFRAFASVEALTRKGRPTQLLCDAELIAWFAASICVDETSLLASWWFALYCAEPWALQKLREPESQPVQQISALRSALPSLLRQAIAARGLDPVAQLRTHAQRLPGNGILKPQRFVDWILDYGRLDDRELRLAIAFALLLMEELGQPCASLLEVPVAAGISDHPPSFPAGASLQRA